MGEILGLSLQARTLIDILRETMDGGDRAVRRPSLKERLGLKGFTCCGPTWGLGPTTIEEEEEEVDGSPLSPRAQIPAQIPPCGVHSPGPSGMNLAAALAAERQLRAALDSDLLHASPPAAPGTPARVSLMRLLEETMDGCDEGRKEEGGGCDSVCCVCMGRKKGAAFIPCGHTFCRVCSREVWLNRGFCPLCNRSILEILDIY